MLAKFLINKMDKKSSSHQKQNTTNINSTGAGATITVTAGPSLAAAAAASAAASKPIAFPLSGKITNRTIMTNGCGAGGGAGAGGGGGGTTTTTTTTTTTLTKTVTLKGNSASAVTTTTTSVLQRGRKVQPGTDATSARSSNPTASQPVSNTNASSFNSLRNSLASRGEVAQPTASTNIAILQQMQKQAQPEEFADKLLRSTRRNAMKELSALHEKSLTARDKNEEAIKELETRIPELGKIFDIGGRIGSGTFSTVLLATLKRERELPEMERRKFAIKHHNPTNHPDRIIRELECMFKMGGTENIIGINCCIRYNDSIAFIMPYMSHDRFHDIFRTLTLFEIKDYMRNLLIALRHVHKFNVIHRDVKPSNILYNRHTRQFLLCDFGLAQRLTADGTVSTQTGDLVTAQPAGVALNDATKTNSVESTNTERFLKRITCAKDHDSIKRMRAMGGGGGVDNTVVIAPAGGNAGDILDAPYQVNAALKAAESPSPTFMAMNEQRLQAIKSFATMSKKDVAAQRADTNRLINRLRQVGSNIDVNNYVVSTNTNKKEMHASRAGTPGYRPPEVLLRYPHQTTGVDVWAAGVILFSIMSATHPFFKAPNDCSALAEIMNLFGDLAIRKTAFMLDRLVMLTQKVTPLDLRRVCMRFRHSDAFTSPEQMRRYRRPDGQVDICRNCDQNTYNCLCKHPNCKIESYDNLDVFPSAAYDLLHRLLEVNPAKRITAEEALKHPFLSDHPKLQQPLQVPIMPRNTKMAKDGVNTGRQLRSYLTQNYTVPIVDTQSMNQLNNEMPPK